MNWIIWTTIMFSSSVFLYIGVRELKEYNLPTALINLGMLGLPIFPVLAYICVIGYTIHYTWEEFLAIVISIILFAFGGNIASIKGQSLAPNPGFSLIIQKSYGSFTILLAPLLFNSPLSIFEVIGALLVFLSSGLIAIDTKRKLFAKENKWIPATLLSYILFGFLSISNKYFLEKGVQIFALLLIMFAVNFIISGLQTFEVRKKIRMNTKIAALLIGLGILSFIFNLSMVEAYDTTPNIGFVNTANAGSIAALTIASWLIYKDEMNPRKIIGVLGVILGLVMIFV